VVAEVKSQILFWVCLAIMVFVTESELEMYVKAKLTTSNNWKSIVSKMLELNESSVQKIPAAIEDRMNRSLAPDAQRNTIQQVRNRLKTFAKKSRLV
jgi:TRAP-type mannitol/chloroaromatic compound transport system substrate-binding protein